jgi:hypothetical protein
MNEISTLTKKAPGKGSLAPFHQVHREKVPRMNQRVGPHQTLNLLPP